MHTELIGTEVVVPRTDSQAVAKVGGGQAVHVGWVARQEGGAQTVRQARTGLSWTTIPKEGGVKGTRPHRQPLKQSLGPPALVGWVIDGVGRGVTRVTKASSKVQNSTVLNAASVAAAHAFFASCAVMRVLASWFHCSS